MKAQTKPLVIIPAAGFGRRVGSPNSKEILRLDQGRPLIETAFSESEARKWPLHLLTRSEKTELIDYSLKRGLSNLQIQYVSVTKEWPATVLLSEPVWHEWNLLFLPDLLFRPLTVLDQMIEAVGQRPELRVVAAGTMTSKPQLWGCLKTVHAQASSDGKQGFSICEKPQESLSEWAWGLMMFHQSTGRDLFESLLQSGTDHQWKHHGHHCQTFELAEMSDPTR